MRRTLRRVREITRSSVQVHPYGGRPRVRHRLPKTASVPGVLLPVVIIVVVAIPILLLAYRAATRSQAAGEHPVTEDPRTVERTEQEFAAAEAYQEQWREEEKKHQPDTLL